MAKNRTIAAQFNHADRDRWAILDRARKCAELSKPWVLPPENHRAGDELPENHQSLGSRGITNLEGRMLLALWPPEVPWFRLQPAAEIRYSRAVDPQTLQEIEQELFLYELVIQATLESANLSGDDRRRRTGFRNRKRQALSQILVTGDCLEQITDDYRIKVFRRDQYVTRRDSAGDVLFHIVCEEIDPLALTDWQLERAGLDRQTLREAEVAKRLKKLFTRVQWNPESRKWVIEQEIGGRIIAESEEPISPYISTAFELAPGEDYGRGFIELNFGDLLGLDTLALSLIDFAAMASKMQPAIDETSNVREADLARRSGEPIRARVRNGEIQDIAFLKVDKLGDFQVVEATASRIARDLAAAMLLESAIQPQKERVTATQIQRIAMELEGALGGLYAPVADEQQVPLLRRVIYQLKRDAILPPLPDEAVEISALTGITALGREVRAARVLSVAQIIGQLGPEALRRLDVGVLVDVLMRYQGVYEPGMIKSREQLEQEAQQAIQQQLAVQAGEKAIDTAGNIAEAAMAQAATNQPQQQ